MDFTSREGDRRGGDRAAGRGPQLAGAQRWGGAGPDEEGQHRPDPQHPRPACLVAGTERVDADIQIDRPDGHESMGSVIPWNDKQFQYTVKENTLPASGSLRVDGRDLPLPEARRGRCWTTVAARWPYSTTWNWGSGSGRTEDNVIGLQFGGKWTEGTGMTENAVCIDAVG